MIDAIIIGKPCLTIMTARYRRTQEQVVHFKHLLDADVLEVTQTTDAAIETIGRLLNGKDPHCVQRQQFIHRFVRPLSMQMPAGKVAAKAIEMMAQGKQVHKIKAKIGADDFSEADTALERTAS
jgi:hypothetical protein